MSRLAIYTFGAPRIEEDQVQIQVDTRKAIALLVFLAIQGSSHRRESLATLLWPDYDQAHAMGALRRTLSALRKALGGEFLEISRDSVGFAPGSLLWVDAHEFHSLLGEWKSHGHSSNQVCQRCMPALEQAVHLYQGDFMLGFTLRDSIEFDDWQFFQREELRRELVNALEKLTLGYAAQGDFQQAIQAAKRQLVLDPLDEPAHRQLMKLYAQAGQYHAALRQYQECARILQEQLGVSPLEETTRLFHALKEQRSDSPVSTPIEVVREVAPSSPEIQMPVVGREVELQSLMKAYRAVKENGYFIAIEGETGSGKTRLAEEFIATARLSGARVASARCYPDQDNLAYAPIVEGMRRAIQEMSGSGWQRSVPGLWLKEAARLLPELGTIAGETGADVALNSPGAQIRFYEGVSQVLLALCGADPPGVLFLDDLQWADEATLDFLSYAVRRLPGRPLLILATWIGQDLSADHRLLRILSEAQRIGLAECLHLSRLTPEAVSLLVETAIPVSGMDLQTISRRLYQESEGLPFFVVEYLIALQQETALYPDEAWSIPAGVRDLIRARLELIGEAGKQLLQTAAVIGRSFDFETLRDASGRTEEETVATLENLIERGMIRETLPPGLEVGWRDLRYDFNHDKVRSLVYAETSLTRRRLLHHRVAQALIQRARGRHDAYDLLGQIAYHLKQGGHALEAAEYYRRAADHARAIHANADALANYQSALALGNPNTASLNEAIGDMQTLLGDYSAALRSYDAAAAHYQAQLKPLARLEHKLGELYARLGDWERCESHFQIAAEALTTENDLVALARLYADWSRTAHRQGQARRAEEMAERALNLATSANSTLALAQAQNVLGILARARGGLSSAICHLEASLAAAQNADEVAAQIAALNNLSLAYADQGELTPAIQCAKNALQLCQALGDRHREAALHNNLADLYHMDNQADLSMHHLKQAVAIFAEIGEAGYEQAQPEIWRLMEW